MNMRWLLILVLALAATLVGCRSGTSRVPAPSAGARPTPIEVATVNGQEAVADRLSKARAVADLNRARLLVSPTATPEPEEVVEETPTATATPPPTATPTPFPTATIVPLPGASGPFAPLPTTRQKLYDITPALDGSLRGAADFVNTNNQVLLVEVHGFRADIISRYLTELQIAFLAVPADQYPSSGAAASGATLQGSPLLPASPPAATDLSIRFVARNMPVPYALIYYIDPKLFRGEEHHYPPGVFNASDAAPKQSVDVRIEARNGLIKVSLYTVNLKESGPTNRDVYTATVDALATAVTTVQSTSIYQPCLTLRGEDGLTESEGGTQSNEYELSGDLIVTVSSDYDVSLPTGFTSCATWGRGNPPERRGAGAPGRLLPAAALTGFQWLLRGNPLAGRLVR